MNTPVNNQPHAQQPVAKANGAPAPSFGVKEEVVNFMNASGDGWRFTVQIRPSIRVHLEGRKPNLNEVRDSFGGQLVPMAMVDLVFFVIQAMPDAPAGWLDADGTFVAVTPEVTAIPEGVRVLYEL